MPKYLPCGKNFLCTHTLEKYLAYIYTHLSFVQKLTPKHFPSFSCAKKKKIEVYWTRGKQMPTEKSLDFCNTFVLCVIFIVS